MNTEAQRTADLVDAELCWGTAPTLIAALINPSLTVQHIVSALSRFGHNTTATRLYDAWQIQRKALA